MLRKEQERLANEQRRIDEAVSMFCAATDRSLFGTSFKCFIKQGVLNTCIKYFSLAGGKEKTL